MNKVTKIAVLVVIVGATIAALVFYAIKSKPAAVQEAAQTSVDSPAPKASKATADADSLPELPKDNKQAIASEVKGIEDSIKSVDDALSADTQDGELGL